MGKTSALAMMESGEVEQQWREVEIQRDEVEMQRGEVEMQRGEVEVQRGEVEVHWGEVEAGTSEQQPGEEQEEAEEKKGPTVGQGGQIYQTLRYDEEADDYVTDLDEDTDVEQERVDKVDEYLNEEDRAEYNEVLEFHQEYQRRYGGNDSIRAIMRKHVNRYQPPIPQQIIRAEMQGSEMANEVEVVYEERADGTTAKRIKPIFVKNEPDKEYATLQPAEEEFPWFPDEQRLPKLPPGEVIGYTNEELEQEEARWHAPEDDDELMEMENLQPELNIDTVEENLHQIAAGLRTAAAAYDAISLLVKEMAPYQAHGVIQSLPATPTMIPAPLAKALTADGPDEVINKLIRHDHEQLSYTKLEEKYGVSRHRVTTACLQRKRHDGSSSKYRGSSKAFDDPPAKRTRSLTKTAATAPEEEVDLE